MIGNDIGRSLDFVKAPVEAGRLAKFMPFSFQIVIALFALCAIISVIIANILAQVIPVDPAQLTVPENASELERMIYVQLQKSLDFFNSNPIITALFSTVLATLSSVLLFVVGRNFAPQTNFLESQSALVRFEIVRTIFVAILQSIAILFWSMSTTMGAAFSNVVTVLAIVIIVLKIHVIRGIFEVATFGKAFQIWALGGMCLLGVGFFLSLILTVVMV